MPSPGDHSRRRVLPLALGVVVLIAAAVVGALIANAVNSPSSATTTASGASSAAAGSSLCNVTSIADKELPSVVTIFAGGGTAGGVGSGEVIRSDGYILTNNHVILPAVGGGPLEVVFTDGSAAAATITGRDPLTDLAVIHVSGKSDLRQISVGNSSGLRIGQGVVALGAPLGLSSTVTSGIVSALGRTVHVPGEASRTALLIDAVQTDAAINPGNSGGALVDCAGDLIGIPTAGATIPSPSGEASGGSIGLGFAIPVNLATKVADEIIATGTVTHAFIGIQTEPLTASATGQSGAQGLRVAVVVTGGPAANAGLRVGDIVTSVDGQPATSTDQLMAVTLTKRAGDRVEIGYKRDGRETTATITLAARS
ncbi:MAG: trypsin-like peptidase domain-containing protein [Solirubrobacterales bacterium]|nr:trypsin-like peptidase domain-containing protein [Solirubrobacterales bacterium]